MAEKWDDDTAARSRRIALQAFEHTHPSSSAGVTPQGRKLIIENCGAHVLAGYGEYAPPGRPLRPNYAGWARTYVKAGIPIPGRYRAAFEEEQISTNESYAEGLARDIATFGVRFTD